MANEITNSKYTTKVNGTNGDDYIYNSGHHVTINAGKGNDIVEFAEGSRRSVFQYAEGDGDDTIIGTENFVEDHIGYIHLTSGTISDYEIYKNGDHVLKIGSGSITLKNVLSTTKIPVTMNKKDYRYINGKRFFDIDSNGNNFYTTTPVKGTNEDDFINVGGDHVTIQAGNGDDYILHNNYYANKDFVLEGESGNDTIENLGSYTTLNGGVGDDILYANGYMHVIKYKHGDGNDTIFGFNSYDTLQIVADNYSTLKSGNDILINVDDEKIILIDAINETININFEKSSADDDLQNVTLTNKDKSTYTAADDVGTIDASKRTKAIKIIGNSKNNLIKGGSSNDTLSGGFGNDTLEGGKGNDIFVFSGGDDVITDFVVGKDKIKLETFPITKSEIIGNDLILTATYEGTITVKNGANKKIKIVNAQGKPSSQIFGAKILNVINSDGEKIDTSINPSVEVVNAKSRTQAVYILDNDTDNTIIGGKKSDVLESGKGDDILTGGLGADRFIYLSGNDTITDYNPAQKDIIQLGGPTIDTYHVEGKDVILTTNEGTLTVKNAKNKKITFYDDATNTKVYNDIREKIFTKTDKASSYSAEDFVVLIDASKNTLAMDLTANSNDNVIKGTVKNDTIRSDAGNDSITTGAGKDLIIYSEGSDTITDYFAGKDTIQADSEILSAKYDKKNLIFMTANGSLTLKNVKNKKITITDSTGNTTSQIYDSKTLKLSTNDGEIFDLSKAVNSGVEKISASARKKAVNIIGNSLNNTIIGSKGNDTLTGGGGSNTFVYTVGYGNDTITNYKSTDTIKLNSKKTKITSTEVSGDDFILHIGKNSIVLQNPLDEIINIKDFSGKDIQYNTKNSAFAMRNYNELLTINYEPKSGGKFNERSFS